MKLTNPVDIERRSRLIYSIYLIGDPQQKRSDIAKKAGYTPEYLSRLISGERRVSDEAAHNLASALGVREEYLICKDEYITDIEYQKVMDETNNIGKAVSQVANMLGYYDIESLANIIFANLDKDIEQFIIQNRFIKNKSHYLINIKDKKYVTYDDVIYKNFCDDISEYIEFKLTQLYKNFPKKEINKTDATEV